MQQAPRTAFGIYVFPTISESIESVGWGFLLCPIDTVYININLWDSHSVRGCGRGHSSLWSFAFLHVLHGELLDALIF